MAHRKLTTLALAPVPQVGPTCRPKLIVSTYSVQHVDGIDMTSHFRPDLPFNTLPALPPAAELETPAVLKACILARAALAELNAARSAPTWRSTCAPS